MKKFYSTILIAILATAVVRADNYPSPSLQYSWTNSHDATTGEAVVATINASNASYPYNGAQLVGQIVDSRSNWGQALPVVANFKVSVNFSGSLYLIVQDVKTPDVTLELRFVSPTQVNVVANCLNPFKTINILFRFPAGLGTTMTVGDASPNSSGAMLVAGPTYASVMDGQLALNVTDINKAAGYTLAVGGSAIAESVTVKLQSGWPDFVFRDDYRLPALADVKAFIDQNHHLPEIPSEAAVAKDGLNLGEMNKLLLKKVEELTLYLIESNKRQAEQDERIRALEAKPGPIARKAD
ncbi:hypothetical protein [Mucilaginibacter sp. FT3.2]|uniref:hypothetical protein n=1 Tax=Mucilaginibacter sp. FT3.2 TaxID=2723090 RepID=UPI001615629B|nr:hypothetical protein [Mucilaginibacter sp. FT3.2]MBB6235276.1 hypothetical protein [Mucilaginibacter sp. FT3.2]